MKKRLIKKIIKKYLNLMGCDYENNYPTYEELSNNLCNIYYNLSYEDRKLEYKRYVRREFELFYECLCKAGNDTSLIDKIFSIHQASENTILKYFKEEPCSCTNWTIIIVIILIILGFGSKNMNNIDEHL